MKTFRMFWVLGVLVPCALCAQVTTPSNFGFITDYVGWDGAMAFPLNISHGGNQQVNILQNGLMRMRFQNVATWNGLNGMTGMNLTRSMISSNGNMQLSPFSVLQLGVPLGLGLQRRWMNIGTTYGTNADILYVGMIERPTVGNASLTDAVLAWGCNDDNYLPVAGPDNFRFIFITPTDLTADLGDNTL